MVRVPWCTPPLGVPSAADLIREGIVVNLIRRERAAMPAQFERRCLVAISHPSVRNRYGQAGRGLPGPQCPRNLIAALSNTGFRSKNCFFFCNNEV